MTEPIRVAAPAKINLYLHVVGRRPDGYHLLDSLVAFADIGDTVEARADERLSLAVDGPFADAIPAGDDNLVLRAGYALAELAGEKRGAAIRLTKRLPAASGIGGGSADAAAALRALMCLWNANPAPEALAALALRLGADVPVCLGGRAAFMGGIGEELAPAPPLPKASIVLANPGQAVATPEVFRRRTGPFSRPARFAEAPGDAARLARLLKARGNDLEEPARAICPAIGDVLAALRRQPGCLIARMSGSGATCFALFAEPGAARAAADAVARAHPAWWVQAGALQN
ncbi:MAG: 4-(cytidine 5'-diphospho)-2-C-methyl-D-erythritol kinase [Rhodospirillales bacterium]|nr:4-(cytidine 5'-diphospho)-2-C-methyl-D-erythritol kinase [Rhodospirillales bacterium]